MPGKNSGTIRKLTINGVSYDTPADINITMNPSGFTIEEIATTGDTVYKMTRKNKSADGITLITNSVEAKALADESESLADKTFAIELADGSTWRTTGKFNYEGFETEELKSTIRIMPNKAKNPWTLTPGQ